MIRAYYPEQDADPLTEHALHLAQREKAIDSHKVASAFGIPFARDLRPAQQRTDRIIPLVVPAAGG